ncbi:hypothetical protein EsH8_III_001115 [Colletotrichum jinshuiense]
MAGVIEDISRHAITTAAKPDGHSTREPVSRDSDPLGLGSTTEKVKTDGPEGVSLESTLVVQLPSSRSGTADGTGQGLSFGKEGGGDLEKLAQAESTTLPSAPVSNTHAGLPPLPKPVIVPRLDPGCTFPFARAWAPELERHDISQSEWVGFLDRLNILGKPHPGITVAQIMAIGVSFAPVDAAEGIAALIEAGAAGLTAYMARARCQKLIAMMNLEYFGPRGLRVRIVSGKEMRRNLGLQKGDALVAPLGEDTLDMTTQERCLEQLKGRVSELTFSVPGPAPETKAVARLAAWRVRTQLKKSDKAARRARKRAWKKFQQGKELKECKEEVSRVKRVSWVLLQNIEDAEADVIRAKEEAGGKKRGKLWRALFGHCAVEAGRSRFAKKKLT